MEIRLVLATNRAWEERRVPSELIEDGPAIAEFMQHLLAELLARQATVNSTSAAQEGES